MLIEVCVIKLASIPEQEAGKPNAVVAPLAAYEAENEKAAILLAAVANVKTLTGIELSRAKVVTRVVG